MKAITINRENRLVSRADVCKKERAASRDQLTALPIAGSNQSSPYFNRTVKVKGYASWRFHPDRQKLPWVCPRSDICGKGPLPTTCWAITTEARSVLPSFARKGLSGGQKRRRVRFGHPTLLVELAAYALPRYGEPPSQGIAGRVSGQAGSDPGQAAKHRFPMLPVKRKAEYCLLTAQELR